MCSKPAETPHRNKLGLNATPAQKYSSALAALIGEGSAVFYEGDDNRFGTGLPAL